MEDGAILPGDVLIYKHRGNRHVHAALSVGDGFVFTKNGSSVYSPFIFQEQRANEELYFPDRAGMILEVHRPR